MKLKKSLKKKLYIFLALVVLATVGLGIYHFVFKSNNTVKEAKVVNKIPGYGYELKDNKTKEYKEMFEDLKKILTSKNVDEEKYVKQISKMFVYDFYSLNDKSAKTDVGGIDFVYESVKTNFLNNAESTYYKYVESNIYNQRKQQLPVVSVKDIKINEVTKDSFEYNDEEDEEAYSVEVSWDYTDSKYSDYQKKVTLIFVHDDKKLSLVELN